MPKGPFKIDDITRQKIRGDKLHKVHSHIGDKWGREDIIFVRFLIAAVNSSDRPRRWKKFFEAQIGYELAIYDMKDVATSLSRRYPDFGEITTQETTCIRLTVISAAACAGVTYGEIYAAACLIYGDQEKEFL